MSINDNNNTNHGVHNNNTLYIVEKILQSPTSKRVVSGRKYEIFW